MNEVPIRRNTLGAAPRWVHAYVWGIFGVITLVLLALYARFHDTDVWMLWMGNPLNPRGTFAETVRGSIFRTRANTWSNLGYILVGLYAIAYAWWDLRRETTADDPYAVRQPMLMGLFGVACVELGFGSGLMHAALMSWGHKLDVYGMFISLSVLIALQWARWIPSLPIPGRRLPTWPLLGLTAIVLSVVMLRYPNVFGDAAVVTMVLIGLVVANAVVGFLFGKTSQQFRWLVLGFGSLVLAYTIWRLDMARQFSRPDAWLQGHALWHLLTAASLGFMAILYRTECPAPPTA